jgi:hypothetical protein
MRGSAVMAKSPILAAPRWAPDELIFDGHGIGVDSFFAGHPFEAGEDAPVVVFIALHRQAALLVTVLPGQADEMLLGFRECEERSCTERYNTKGDGAAYSPVIVLSIADFGDGRSRDDLDFFAALAEVYVLLTKCHDQFSAGLDVGQRAAVVHDFVAVVAGEDDTRNKAGRERVQGFVSWAPISQWVEGSHECNCRLQIYATTNLYLSTAPF